MFSLMMSLEDTMKWCLALAKEGRLKCAFVFKRKRCLRGVLRQRVL